jgi:alpha-tubulin suppressor-like RCC1 family protein
MSPRTFASSAAALLWLMTLGCDAVLGIEKGRLRSAGGGAGDAGAGAGGGIASGGSAGAGGVLTTGGTAGSTGGAAGGSVGAGGSAGDAGTGAGGAHSGDPPDGGSEDAGPRDADAPDAPPPIVEDLRFQAVASGSSANHTCGITQDGRLFCWGSGGNGRLGRGIEGNSLIPAEEATRPGSWDSLGMGFAHGCAITVDGRLFCWGAGSTGRIGNDDTADSWVPVQEFHGATNWRQVSAGSGHTCAVRTNNHLFCWGSGAGGRLANNSDFQDAHVPIEESTQARDWSQVAAGGSHTCAIKTDGRLFCWGDNFAGALGDNTKTYRVLPEQEHSAATDWDQVATGSAHTCAVKTNRHLYCWGNGGNGRLGNDATTESLVPLREAHNHADWRQVSASREHTCAVKTDNRLFCWGNGNHGRLGDGYTDARHVPTQEATGAHDWLEVTTGDHHTCARKVDGRIFCWGRGGVGRLGNGSTEGSLVPMQLAPAVY